MYWAIALIFMPLSLLWLVLTTEFNLSPTALSEAPYNSRFF
jgi:hypothetical protein